jgi:single-strand DNA-binding protein
MNKVNLTGNLGAAITIKRTKTGKIVGEFSMATHKHYKNQEQEDVKETQWHKVQVWENLAKLVEENTRKGSLVSITGELVYESFFNKDFEKINVTKIKAYHVEIASLNNPDKEDKQGNENRETASPAKGEHQPENLKVRSKKPSK